MLLLILPIALVFSSVGPGVYAEAVLLVIYVLSLEFSAVVKLDPPNSIHVVIVPFPFEVLVRPHINSNSFHRPFMPLAHVLITFRPDK